MYFFRFPYLLPDGQCFFCFFFAKREKLRKLEQDYCPTSTESADLCFFQNTVDIVTIHLEGGAVSKTVHQNK